MAMQHFHRFAFAVVVALAAAIACASGLPEPTHSDVGWAKTRRPESTLAELQHGRKLYVARCAGCHALKSPDMLAPGEWSGEIAEMRSKHGVDIADREQLLIAQYLDSMSARRAVRP
jgi:hypothetical protein